MSFGRERRTPLPPRATLMTVNLPLVVVSVVRGGKRNPNPEKKSPDQ